jgi:Ca2+-binding RTX toxin-like protein
MANAMRAAGFTGSIGVNTAMDYTDIVYGDVAKVLQSLQYLGVNLVRDHTPTVSAATQGAYDTLAKAGVHFDFLVPGGTVSLPTVIAELDAFAKAHPGSIAAVEGSNEINIWPVTYSGQTGMAGGAALQKALYAAVHGDANLAGIPVYALSLGGGSTAEERALGDLSPYADYGNVHIYPDNGESPNPNWLGPVLSLGTIPTGGKPSVITEFGYFTGAANPSWDGVTEEVQAKLELNLLFDAKAAGIQTTYLYELLDGAPDPNLADHEAHYGLFHYDGSPKKAATAIHNLTSILADPGSGAGSGNLNYSLSGMPTTGNSLLLQKASGAFDLALWAEPNIWSMATHTEIAAPTSKVTVNLGQTFQSVKVYDPMLGTASIASYSGVSQIQVNLNDHPLIIETTSAGSGPTITIPPTTHGPLDLAAGSGSDKLVLRISEDAWNGDAQYTVRVDGQQVGGTFTASALHGGGDDTLTLSGNWGTSAHSVTVSFLNDAYGGTPQTDRNLYVDAISYNGKTQAMSSTLLAGTESANFAVMASGTPQTGTTTPGVIAGSAGSEQLVGTAAADTLVGGLGNDTLTGGAGADSFRFLSVRDGLDHVTDFVHRTDHIEVSKAGFGLGNAFVVGSQVPYAEFVAHDGNGANTAPGIGEFIYNTTSHVLLWDADGSGAGAAVPLAVFDNAAVVRAVDIVAIA